MSPIPVQFSPAALEMRSITVPSDTFRNDGATLVPILNESGATIKAQVQTKLGTHPHATYHVDTVSVASGGGLLLLGPLTRSFNDTLGYAQIDWLDAQGDPLETPAGVSVGAISMMARGQAQVYTPGPGSVFALQTPSPPEIPVQTTSGQVAFFQPGYLGTHFRARGGEMLFFRNDRGVSIRLRVLAQFPCQDGVLHHVDHIVADSSFVVVGPFSMTEYRNSRGMIQFLPLAETTGNLLADGTEMGAAVIRPFAEPA